MPRHYTPVPNNPSAEEEMNAAFDNDDSDDDDDFHNDGHSQGGVHRPLLRSVDSHSPLPVDDSSDPLTQQLSSGSPPSPTLQSSSVPGAYNFEEDWVPAPPPGSPPGPSARAIPNDYGNSNGQVPTSPIGRQAHQPSIFRRAVGAILPSHYAHGVRGGGLDNDGVFGNIMAKGGTSVSAPVGGAEGPYWVPENAQKDAPPTYQSAQMDAVPSYWENTILAPNGPSDGDIIVDGLPVGSVFSFAWSLLVSVSFQFVGFLFTYLLHTTHAAKYGSRAGLGITLVQYGFYLRSPGFADQNGTDTWTWPPVDTSDETTGEVTPTHTFFATAAEATKYFGGPPASPNRRTNIPAITPAPANSTDSEFPDNGFSPEAMSFATEWISFALMTVGWFLLLTSLLGFFRVKRWEKGIQNSHARSTAAAETHDVDDSADGGSGYDRRLLANLDMLGLVDVVSNRVRGSVGRGTRRGAEQAPLTEDEDSSHHSSSRDRALSV